MIPVVLTPRPMAEPDTLLQPAGRTVRAMLVDAVAQGRIEAKYLGQAELHVDGVAIPRDQALDHVLEEGQIVNLVVYPHGGGGGGGKDVGQILLQVAVIAVSMWVGGGAGGAITSQLLARVASAAVMVAGNMAINALYAPKASAEKVNDRYALQSASNAYRQWGMAPLMLGPCVVAPDLAVKTFTRAIGDDVWIYGILAHHYGPCQLDELKIGDTLVSSMGASDVKFVHHLTPGPRTFSLVPNDIDQLDLAPEELTATTSTATPVVRASGSEGETFELDFYLPGGLYFQKDDGRKIAASVTITVRYREVDQFGDPVGSGAWTAGLTIPLTGSSKDPLRITRSLNLPMGRYEFEVKRSVLEDTNEKRHTDVAWSAIRAIAYRKPVTDEVLSISEFAVRATALNQGNLAPITCKITPLCQTWTGTEWGPPVPTANPAALTRWLLTGPAPAKPLLSAQADQGLRAWSVLCDEYGWEAHIPIQEDRTQAEALALLERAGRAGVFWDGTQAVASCWVEKPVPKQMFTGVNLKDHRFEIAYADPVHAFRVEFQNLEQRGEADEIMVYNDGYAETAGVDDNGDPVAAATLIEALRLEDGQKTPERAYRDARWELGRRKHQRRFDTWSSDVEAVVCRYGDRVRLAWSRAGGEGGARVRARRWSAGEGSSVTGLRLDREIEMSPGVDYVVDLRLVDQLLTGVPVVNPAVDGPVQTREIIFVDARAAAVAPRRGDMIAFGPVEQVTEDVEILGLEPGEGLTANLTGVRYVAPLLMAGETGPIPELTTRLTLDRLKDPPRPTLLGVQVSVDGVRAGFSLPPWKGSPVTAFTVRWRVKPEAGEQSSWLPLPDLAGDAMTLTTPPLRELPGEDEATRVEIEIRAVTASGQTSPALAFTAVLPVVATPVEAVWSVTPRGTAEDGTSQPVLIVSGTVTDPAVGRVSIAYGLTETGPWNGSYEGPAGTVSHEIKGLVSSVDYWVLITYASPQGVAGGSLVIGPRTTPALSAAIDPATLAAIDADIAALFGDVSDVSAALSDAQDLIDAQGVEIATARGGQANLNARIVQVNQARIDGDASNATAISGLEARTGATEADVIDLEIALAGETTARGEQISQLRSAAIEGALNHNGTFADYPDPAMPSKWGAWNYNAALWDVARVAGRFAQYAFQQHDNLGGVPNDCGIAQSWDNGVPGGLANAAPGYYVLQADCRLPAGGWGGAGVFVYSPSGSDGRISFATDPDTNGAVGNSVSVGASRSWRKLIRLDTVPNGRLVFHLMTQWAGFDGAKDPKIIIWDRCSIRPATDAEIAAGTVLPGLSATVTEHSLSIIDLELQAALASYEVVANASGGQPAILRLVSSTAGGYAVLAGPKVVLGTLDGSTLIEVLSIYGTKARFSGDVEIDGNLTLDGTLNGGTKIIKGTVRPAASSYAAGTVTLSGTTPSTVAEVVIETSGSPVIVEFLALMDMKHEPASSFTMYVELRRQLVDGSNDLQVQYEFVNGAGDTADNFTGKWPIKIKDTYAGAGTWRYYVRVWVSASNMTVKDIRNRFMSAEEDLTNT